MSDELKAAVARIEAKAAELLVQHPDATVNDCLQASMVIEAGLHGVPGQSAPEGITGKSILQTARESIRGEMAKTIWKFDLAMTDRQQLTLPSGFSVLSVGVQAGELKLWAAVDPSRRFGDATMDVYIVGTGNPLTVPGYARFIGTAIMPPFVWHVYVH